MSQRVEKNKFIPIQGKGLAVLELIDQFLVNDSFIHVNTPSSNLYGSDDEDDSDFDSVSYMADSSSTSNESSSDSDS